MSDEHGHLQKQAEEKQSEAAQWVRRGGSMLPCAADVVAFEPQSKPG